LRDRAIGKFPIIEVVPRIDVLTQGFFLWVFFFWGGTFLMEVSMERKRWRHLFILNENQKAN